MTTTTAQSPTGHLDRVLSLDVIRGVAVLGILVMNTMAFALPSGTSIGARHGGGPDMWVLNLQDIFFDGRMRGLFSMLFGAGALLFLDRLERGGAGLRTADLYYRRLLWLLLFGLVHAWVLLWPGDILYGYALCGLFLFPLRRAAPRGLFIAGVSLLAVSAMQAAYSTESDRSRWEEATLAAARQATGEDLSTRESDALEWREDRVATFAGIVDDEKRAKEVTTRRGSYIDVWLDAAPKTYRSQGERQYSSGMFDQLGAMLLGMALLRLGFFAGTWRPRFYAALIAIGYGGVASGVAFLDWQWAATGTPPDAFGQLHAYDMSYSFARIAVALAHASCLILLVRANLVPFLTSRLAATGRMALTHYVSQTVVVGIFLFGPVCKQFGALSRSELMPVIAVVCFVQVAVSRPWLERFRFGPLEWLWRSLTYGERQPMRRAPSTPLTPSISTHLAPLSGGRRE